MSLLTEYLKNIFATKKHVHKNYPTKAEFYASKSDLENWFLALPQFFSMIGHTHDERYYTESEVDALLAAHASSPHGGTVPNIPYFRATRSSDQLVYSSVWTQITFDTNAIAYNSPGFNTSTSKHIPGNDVWDGLWSYNAILQFTADPGFVGLRVTQENVGNIFTTWRHSTAYYLDVSFDAVWQTNSGGLYIEIYVLNPLSVVGSGASTFLEGVRVGTLNALSG